ncbi:MAG: leucyl aminopeptidase [Bryobacteraceae bacterium]
MKTKIVPGPVSAAAGDALIVPALEDKAPVLGAACDETLARIFASGEFKGKAQEVALIHAPAGLAAARLILAGCGKTPDLRRAFGAAARFARQRKFSDLAAWLPADLAGAEHVEAATEGVLLGDYEPDFRKSEPVSRLVSFSLSVAGDPADAEAAFARAVVLGEAQNFARDLGNEPSNVMNPTELANRARLMANQTGLEIEIIDEDRLRQLGMRSLLGVAQGSAEPPLLIIVRYLPPTENTPKDHLGLVGKAVTFDSGGISIKPADGMEKMKYDMCGGAAVLGAMQAIAALKPPVAVTAFVPAVENMVSGQAQRPGDIVKTLSGKTVEVLNTDAEGRLILNDTITYARQLGCTHLVDAATLTGSVVVALGHVYTGGYTNDPVLFDRLQAAARRQGEKIWQMPCEEEYKDALKSAFADMANIGTRWGGSITAAWFLREFADPTPWVHLDVAGTAWLDEAKAWMAKGPTGAMVRTFAELAASWR